MRLPLFNHIRLLRYAGLVTYACVGIPMLLYRPGDNPTSDTERYAVIADYAIFGFAYCLATADMASRRSSLLRIPTLFALYATTMVMGYLSTPALSAILLVVIASLLPWLLPLLPGAIWMVLQNFSL